MRLFCQCQQAAIFAVAPVLDSGCILGISKGGFRGLIPAASRYPVPYSTWRSATVGRAYLFMAWLMWPCFWTFPNRCCIAECSRWSAPWGLLRKAIAIQPANVRKTRPIS